MQPDKPSFYIHATKDNITVIRFARDANVAATLATDIAEWSGNREAVHVEAA
jgi:hypothetical protein